MVSEGVSEKDDSAAAAARVAGISGQKERAGMPRAGKTVLCIDDHENALAGWSLFLHGSGYGVLTAANPSEGLQLFGTKAVDAVLLDYSMPDMDGLEVAQAMKRIKPEVPIIFFTGHTLPKKAIETVDAVVFKGEPPQAVLMKLDELLHAAA